MVIDKDSVAHEQKIVPGVRQGERVQIVTGLQEGEQVVTSGGLGLEDKAKVAIQQPKSEDEDEDSDDDKDEKK
jgi:multidrug efflux pump subunit AcrA (membrane-fusion protein)